MALPRSWLASFPDDVVEDILTRLPPKPLVRFRCVSRRWKSNIAEPEFIEKHLTVNKAKSLSDYYNNDNNNVGFLLWGEQRRVRLGSLDLYTVVCNTDGSLTEISRWMVPGSFKMGGFCNGIFYSVEPRMTFFKNASPPDYSSIPNPVIDLWNPSIRKRKELPRVLNGNYFETCAYQLAFPTSQNNDLKFLVFGRKRGVPFKKLGAQVYTLSTDSWSWVELQVDSLDIGSVGPITRIAPSPHLFYNGALHFIATTSRDYTFILCFDVDNKQFREIKLPHNYSNGLSLKFKQLVVLKGSLALIALGQDEAVCRIWVMSEYGLVDSSWTPTLSVPLSGVEDFLGCTGSGELVIRKSGNQVFLFGPENQNEEDLGIQNLTQVEDLSPLVFTANLIESLVLLDELSVGLHL